MRDPLKPRAYSTEAFPGELSWITPILRCFVTLVAATGALGSGANSIASPKAVEIVFPLAVYFSVFKLVFPMFLGCDWCGLHHVYKDKRHYAKNIEDSHSHHENHNHDLLMVSE